MSVHGYCHDAKIIIIIIIIIIIKLFTGTASHHRVNNKKWNKHLRDIKMHVKIISRETTFKKDPCLRFAYRFLIVRAIFSLPTTTIRRSTQQLGHQNTDNFYW